MPCGLKISLKVCLLANNLHNALLNQNSQKCYVIVSFQYLQSKNHACGIPFNIPCSSVRLCDAVPCLLHSFPSFSYHHIPNLVTLPKVTQHLTYYTSILTFAFCQSLWSLLTSLIQLAQNFPLHNTNEVDGVTLCFSMKLALYIKLNHRVLIKLHGLWGKPIF